MYFCFAKKGRILSKLFWFAMEGSHRMLKRMLRTSVGRSPLRGRLGVQLVVDNHTFDDSVVAHSSIARLEYDQEGTTRASAHQCTKVRGPSMRTDSHPHAAPFDLREAVPMLQEKDIKDASCKDQGCLYGMGCMMGRTGRKVRVF